MKCPSLPPAPNDYSPACPCNASVFQPHSEHPRLVKISSTYSGGYRLVLVDCSFSQPHSPSHNDPRCDFRVDIDFYNGKLSQSSLTELDEFIELLQGFRDQLRAL